MIRCSHCGFVWNAAFDPARISYDAGYNNDVTGSAYYRAHMEAMADHVLASVPADQPIHYVEIGCGEGDFLRLLHERAQGRVVSAVGFDPSYSGTSQLPQGVHIEQHYFTPDRVALIPSQTNVICSRHTIEHVENVQGFAQSLAAAMAPGRQMFLETPDANWILRTAAFQDFFYEHCALYTPHSIAQLLAKHGLSCDVSPVYDAQYMWIRATMATAKPQQPSAVGNALAQSYVGQKSAMMTSWEAYLAKRSAFGPVAVWGAASKGVTFSILLNSNAELVSCGIDVNRSKQGCFMPVSGTPILSPQQAQDMGVATIVIMNPNYEHEIRSQVAAMKWDAEITVLKESTALTA